jgi:hypothetical protein
MFRLLIIAVLLSTASLVHATKPIDNETLTGKLVMGYQGWFECPADRKDGRWVHWYNETGLSVDALPDVTDYPHSGRCETTMHLANGDDVEFFSSQNLGVVETHFAWMETYGLDGVALQRFASPLLDPVRVAAMDTVLANVSQAAKDHGRVFYLMYDLSGMPAAKLGEVVKDWQRLEAGGLTRRSGYLRHRGHPLLGLWGLGFAGRDMTPDEALSLIESLKNASAAYGGATIMAGVPAGWRTGTGDAASDPRWQRVWRQLGVLSPWTVGRFEDDAGADYFRAHNIVPDLAEAARLKVDYLPVVFPGFSWANMMTSRHEDSSAKPNQIPRRCGRFYWRQVFDATSAGATMLYGAMFDEVDEGTAIFKVASSVAQRPVGQWFLTLDADGCALPSDWYLRLTAAATDALRKRRAASQDLPLKLPAGP